MGGVGSIELSDVVGDFPLTYLITVGPDSAPHLVEVRARFDEGILRIERAGPTTRGNAVANPAVTLLYPPPSKGERCLIVDGTARIAGIALAITPTRAILHRDNPAWDPAVHCGTACRSVRLDPGVSLSR